MPLFLRRYRLLCVLFLLLAGETFATHYRAGEITYRRISDRRYKVTVITYTDPRSDANPNTVSVTINWGDTKSEVIQRTRLESFWGKNNVQRNIYEAEHTYQTDGTYLVSVTDPNRVGGILNINASNSRDIPFYIESLIFINSSVGSNESPILLNPPIDDGCVNFLYTHNPGAADTDGDSLVFRTIPPKQGRGTDVPLYVDPFHSDSFAINPITGTVFWANPNKTGIYNIAIQILEYRNGIFVGMVTRDMQIEIFDCPNSPPFIAPMTDDCVRVGDNISRTVSTSDVNLSQTVFMDPVGYAFVQPIQPATISPFPANGPATGFNVQFNWRPICSNIRNQPHQILFKVRDNFTRPATYIDGFFLKVNAPEPKNIRIVQEGRNAFRISWDPDSCGLATQYDIYRKIDSSFWNPGRCVTGIPGDVGFEKIANVDLTRNPNTYSIVDSGSGEGLTPLITYCYRVVAKYPARDFTGAVIGGKMAESYASIEVCDNIIRSKPIITRVSVERTDGVNGLIELTYLRPDTLDTLTYLPPYVLNFKRKSTPDGAFTFIRNYTFNSFNAITDSTFIDSLINTRDSMWYYEIDFLSNITTTAKFIDSSPDASSVYAQVYATDNANLLSWIVDVPWINDTFVVLRKNASNTFDSIGVSTTPVYRDEGLTNGVTYCYIIQNYGYYSLLSSRTLNNSQEVCGTPVDTIPPCPPPLVVTPPCEDVISSTVRINWTQDSTCADDLFQYKLYYKQQETDPYELIATLPFGSNQHLDERIILQNSIAGCYAISAIDSNGNESELTQSYCIDNCPRYAIPNVFTPNGDGTNDVLNPFPYRFINRIYITIYNRWGNVVYQTNDIDINWNGRDLDSAKPVSDGVYYYICDVYERFLEGEKKRTLRGTIQIIR